MFTAAKSISGGEYLNKEEILPNMPGCSSTSKISCSETEDACGAIIISFKVPEKDAAISWVTRNCVERETVKEGEVCAAMKSQLAS